VFYTFVFVADMVLKKSKHDLNTGNTLRKHATCMLEKCHHGTMRFKLDTDAIESWIDRVHCSLSDSRAVALRNTDIDLMLMLTRLMEWHSVYEMEDDSVEYSLSKQCRWNFNDYLMMCLDNIYMSLVESGFELQFKVKENFGFWFSHDFVSLPQHDRWLARQKQQAQRRKSTNVHVRGIQRKWKCSDAEHKIDSIISAKTAEKDNDSINFDDDSNEEDSLSAQDFKPTR